MYRINDLFDLEHTQAADYLSTYEYPWEALTRIEDFIIGLGKTLGDDYKLVSENIWIHETVKIEDDNNVYIGGPCIIGANTEIRHSAYIRGAVLIGENCVIGNSTELKNAILFDNVQVPHYNYVGDSILGFSAHMGAGAVISNLKGDKSLVQIKSSIDGEIIDTGLRKVGAMIGDFVEIGCNSTLNPGSVVGRNTNIYPLSIIRGVVPENSIVKNMDNIVEKESAPESYKQQKLVKVPKRDV